MSRIDRNISTKPTLPTLGPAGSFFDDPAFGTRIYRCTDANTGPAENINASWQGPGAGSQHGWNSSSTRFYVTSRGGGFHLFDWNPTTKVATWNRTLPFTFDACFSTSEPDIIYGCSSVSPYANGHTVVRVNVGVTPSTVTLVVDCGTLVTVPNPSYMNAVAVGSEFLAFSCGGASQDDMTHVIWWPIANPAGRKILNTTTAPAIMNTNHSVTIDLSGRYVIITPKGAIPYNLIVWDTTLDTVYPVTISGGGHGAFNHGGCINGDILTNYDAAQWIYRDLNAPNTTARELISPLMLPQEVYMADHSSWYYCTPGNNFQPIVISTFRVYDGPNNIDPKNLTPWRAWDDEIISVATASTDRTVWRHCHHRSLIYPDTGTAPFDFFYTPRANCSPNGQWIMFTSNMEKTLGNDPYDLNKRRDVFICGRDMSSSGGPPPPPPPPPAPIPAPGPSRQRRHRLHGR